MATDISADLRNIRLFSKQDLKTSTWRHLTVAQSKHANTDSVREGSAQTCQGGHRCIPPPTPAASCRQLNYSDFQTLPHTATSSFSPNSMGKGN